MKNHHRSSPRRIFTAAGVLLGLLVSSARAQTISLDFNSLPSAQGWTYSVAGAAVPEGSVFSVNNGTLQQNTVGKGPLQAGYILQNGVSFGENFTVSLRARIVEEYGPALYGFYVGFSTPTSYASIGIGSNSVRNAATGGILGGVAVDTSIFHDYRFQGTAGGGFSLYVDNQLKGTVSASNFAVAAADQGIFLGDGTPTGSNAWAEISSFTYRLGTDVTYAGATDNAFSDTNRTATLAGPPTTISYQSLVVEGSSLFELGSNETLNLDNGNGTLHITEGSIFSSNGTVNGSIFNEGLLRIPITKAGLVSQTTGGVVQVVVEPPTIPGTPIILSGGGQPIVVDGGTFLNIGGSGGGGTSGGGFSAGPSATAHANPTAAHYVITDPLAPVEGTVAWDGRLDVTGSFTQTESGYLRMFLAGDAQGETYSFLSVGEEASIKGRLQLVLQPELFGYLPGMGSYFDLIHADGGITLFGDFGIDAYMTALGADLLGLSLPDYLSPFSADPDHLKGLAADLFRYELVDNDTTLRVWLNQEIVVPVHGVPETFNTGLSLGVLLGLAGIVRGLGRGRQGWRWQVMPSAK